MYNEAFGGGCIGISEFRLVSKFHVLGNRGLELLFPLQSLPFQSGR